MLNDVYEKAEAQRNLKFSYYPGPYKFDGRMQADAFDWFDRSLKA